MTGFLVFIGCLAFIIVIALGVVLGKVILEMGRDE